MAKSSDAFGTEVLHVLIDVTEGSTQFQTVDYYDYFEVDEVTLSFISNENFAIYISNYLNWKQKPSLFFLETRRGYAQCHLELTGRKPRDGIPCFILLLTGTVLPMRGTLDWSLLNTAIHTNNELMEAR